MPDRDAVAAVFSPMHTARALFPYAALGIFVAALAYAINIDAPPPADFTFVNGTEIKSVDPAIVTGVPEGRIINAIFEGLYRQNAETLEPEPALAESHTVSEDLKTYTFTIREGANWTDGTPVTSEDFRWSWQRMLHPETGSEYAYQLYDYIEGADNYAHAEFEEGDRVEVELADRTRPGQLFPRGTIVRGKFQSIEKGEKPKPEKDATEEEIEEAEKKWKAEWIYIVEVDGKSQQFSRAPKDLKVEKCLHVLIDFDTVGIETPDDHTLVVRLKSATPYYLDLAAFYPLYPVNRACVEKHGFPMWTRPEHIVTNGPFEIEFRKIRDRIRLKKNPDYWNAENVDLDTVDALATEKNTTVLNLYMNGQVDWATTVPTAIIDELQQRDDFTASPMMTCYFYRLNVNRKPLDNVLVRRALNMAIDKEEICKYHLRAGQVPARSFVPPGMEGYESAFCDEFNPEKARELLAEAGYPGGKGLKKLELLYNTSDGHREIAELLQRHWKKNLGVSIGLKNQEWQVYLATAREEKYDVARAAWVGDYPDPNTFLDLFVSDSPMNQTGWKNEQYDRLIDAAKTEQDPQTRLDNLHDAEAILMKEQPIIPLYFYVGINMVRPYVHGWHPNIQDIHPLNAISIDRDARQKFLESEGLR